MSRCCFFMVIGTFSLLMTFLAGCQSNGGSIIKTECVLTKPEGISSLSGRKSLEICVDVVLDDRKDNFSRVREAVSPAECKGFMLYHDEELLSACIPEEDWMEAVVASVFTKYLTDSREVFCFSPEPGDEAVLEHGCYSTVPVEFNLSTYPVVPCLDMDSAVLKPRFSIVKEGGKPDYTLHVILSLSAALYQVQEVTSQLEELCASSDRVPRKGDIFACYVTSIQYSLVKTSNGKEVCSSSTIQDDRNIQIFNVLGLMEFVVATEETAGAYGAEPLESRTMMGVPVTDHAVEVAMEAAEGVLPALRQFWYSSVNSLVLVKGD